MSLAIETQGLCRRFGARKAVDDVSLHVPQQAVYGFLGRNGAGKTTTLKMLLGLLRPDAGNIRIDGFDMAAQRTQAAYRVGALLEAHGFYTHLSGRTNLELCRRLLGHPAREVDRVLEVVEMQAPAQHRMAGYSLGMRQRLGIARALLGAPPVLVLDEPCNGLDPEGMADMRRFLSELPVRTGATVIVSSHLLGEIEQTATHIGILSQGRLVLQGALDELKSRLAAKLEIRADDLDRAGRVATEHGCGVTAGIDHLEAQLPAGDDTRTRVAALTRALCDAGIAVHAMIPHKPSLDTLYAQASRPTPGEATPC